MKYYTVYQYYFIKKRKLSFLILFNINDHIKNKNYHISYY